MIRFGATRILEVTMELRAGRSYSRLFAGLAIVHYRVIFGAPAMVDKRAKARTSPVARGEKASLRARASETFRASVRAVTADGKPFAALGEMDDLEMMEAATKLTRRS